MGRFSYLILATVSAAGMALSVVALFAVSVWAALLTYAGTTAVVAALVLLLSRRRGGPDAADSPDSPDAPD